MKKILSLFFCLLITSIASASDFKHSSKEVTLARTEVKKLLKDIEAFMCAGEIYVLDRSGNRIRTVLFNDRNASNHLDCLSRFSRAVAEVEAGLAQGETTSGTVSYLP
ncbi:MAG: hypothetical protein ACO1N9_13555 [Flavobacterium sp.]